ncbi:MAG: hypothetical protein K2X29_07540 [Candidatus Obscuribacterales bacterium]|nr:hypothetical protein [Candidatus Obscuribacterales bacterium]
MIEHRTRQLFMVAYRLAYSLCALVMVASNLPAVAQELNPLPSGPKSQFGQPTLSILKPVQGETFGKESIVLDIAVDNFELVVPEPHFGGPTNKPKGHLHIYLDSNPLIATSSTRIMFGTNSDGNLMAPGWHSLIVELVDEDHNVLAERVYKQVQFYTWHSRKPKHSGKRNAAEEVDGANVSGFVK